MKISAGPPPRSISGLAAAGLAVGPESLHDLRHLLIRQDIGRADAHGPDKIAYAFDKAADILADCGFTYYTVFKDRKPEFIKL